jgi:hypothetical protein
MPACKATRDQYDPLVSDVIVERILTGSTPLRRTHYPEEYVDTRPIHLNGPKSLFITEHVFQSEYVRKIPAKYLELYPDRTHIHDDVYIVRKEKSAYRVMVGERVKLKLRKNARTDSQTHRMEFTPLPYSKEMEYYEFCKEKFTNVEFYKRPRRVKFVYIE